MKPSIKDMEAARKSKEAATQRRAASWSARSDAAGIRRSRTAHCACGRVISANKKSCLACIGVIRVDAEVKAVPCEARVGN
jgi:hypothetical protein